MKQALIKYFIESFIVIIGLPYLSISLATSITGLGLAIVLLMAILPAYFILSPLRFDTKNKIIWLIPLYNAILFYLTVRITFNNSADSYLIAYVPLAYFSILGKAIYQRYKSGKFE